VAWNPRGGAPSRKIHGDMRSRYLDGDTELRRVIDELARLADAGLRCLEARSGADLLPLIDESFEVRARVFPLSDSDRALVRIARDTGAVAKLCGSGGAVIGALREDAGWPRLEAAFAASGFAVERARIAEPSEASAP
jgi:glucuronokinase